MKAESGRLKAGDALKNKEREFQSALVVLGKVREDLKAAWEAHEKISQELSKVQESHKRVSQDLQKQSEHWKGEATKYEEWFDATSESSFQNSVS